MKSFFAATALSAVVSCSHNVEVIDESGYPVAGATITPASRSIVYPSKSTDAKGHAFISPQAPAVAWLHIRKNGFETKDHVNYDQPKPIKVVLKQFDGTTERARSSFDNDLMPQDF